MNNAVEMSNIFEKYAPPDRYLLYAVALYGLDLPVGPLPPGIEDLSRRYPGADFTPRALPHPLRTVGPASAHSMGGWRT